MPYYSIFQQLFKFIPRYRFDKKAEATSGNRCCKHFSAWRQFLTCLYAQITGKDSLREIASSSDSPHLASFPLRAEAGDLPGERHARN